MFEPKCGFNSFFFFEPLDQSHKQIQARQTRYQMQQYQRGLSPKRGDAFATPALALHDQTPGKTPAASKAENRGYNKIMVENQLRNTKKDLLNQHRKVDEEVTFFVPPWKFVSQNRPNRKFCSSIKIHTQHQHLWFFKLAKYGSTKTKKRRWDQTESVTFFTVFYVQKCLKSYKFST